MFDEWHKVGPLHLGSVLKLIYKKMAYLHAHTLIKKRQIATIDNATYKVVGVGKKHHIVTPHILLHTSTDFTNQSEFIGIVAYHLQWRNATLQRCNFIC